MPAALHMKLSSGSNNLDRDYNYGKHATDLIPRRSSLSLAMSFASHSFDKNR
jgi:hypothetical protein